jgi:hypothetical protein
MSSIESDMATSNVSHILVNSFNMFGCIGNLLFISISSWFLLDSKQVKIKKIIYFVIEVWLVSIIFLLGFLIFYKQPINFKDIFHSVFPTFYANNWFITCYLLIYGAHTMLNRFIGQVTKRELLNISILMSFIYIFLSTINPYSFFPSPLILWCTLYFLLAYIKKYLPNLANNNKFNYLFLVIGILSIIIEFVVVNILGLKYEIFSHQMARIKTNSSIFVVMVAISLFNIFRTMKIQNVPFINKMASYMLLVYIIHENSLFHTYLRPILLNYVYDFLGQNIIVSVLFFSVILFVVSILLAVIFDGIFRKLLKKTTDILYDFLSNIYAHLQKFLLKLN